MNSRSVGRILKGWKRYPALHSPVCVCLRALRRPEDEKARVQASGTYCEDGKVKDSKYAFRGLTSSDVVDDKSEVACFAASLSVHDLLSVGGASGREGFARTMPKSEKFERPRRADGSWSVGEERVGGALVQGVASSCNAIVSSMLASPQGASEQYIWSVTSSRMVNGCRSDVH